MLEPTLSDSDLELDPDHSARLQQRVDEHRQRCRDDQWPALSETLEDAGADRWALLIQLVHADMELRLRDGQAVRVESYLDRFPELRDDSDVQLGLIAREFELVRELTGTANPVDYADRFPACRDDLLMRLHTAGDEHALLSPDDGEESLSASQFEALLRASNLVERDRLDELLRRAAG
jgi:hypothetical protein